MHIRAAAFAWVLLLALPDSVRANSLAWVESPSRVFDYGFHVTLPDGFGRGPFTLELWGRLDESYPVGECGGADSRLINWCSQDLEPYDGSSWWFDGNWLLDGHNNGNWNEGSFDLQLYGGGRLRWLFGDGSPNAPPGGTWAVQAWPAETTPSLLDGQWHQITLVRRWADESAASLEMWIDGVLIATERSDVRTDMWASYWQNWTQFPSEQPGWFWGAEKQAALGQIVLEDYKGLLDEIRFWSRAKSAQEIRDQHRLPVTGQEESLLGRYPLDEGFGSSACDILSAPSCIELRNSGEFNWSEESAPVSADQLFAADFELQVNAIMQ